MLLLQANPARSEQRQIVRLQIKLMGSNDLPLTAIFGKREISIVSFLEKIVATTKVVAEFFEQFAQQLHVQTHHAKSERRLEKLNVRFLAGSQ